MLYDVIRDDFDRKLCVTGFNCPSRQIAPPHARLLRTFQWRAVATLTFSRPRFLVLFAVPNYVLDDFLRRSSCDLNGSFVGEKSMVIADIEAAK